LLRVLEYAAKAAAAIANAAASQGRWRLIADMVTN